MTIDLIETVLRWLEDRRPLLPRALRQMEVYCHECEMFLSLEEVSRHNQEHKRKLG